MTAPRTLGQREVLAAVADEERVAVLDRSGLLDERADPAFDRVARVAAALVGAPVSFVSLVGLDRQVMPGAVWPDAGHDQRTMTLDESFCQYSVATGEPLVIADASSDPLVRDTPLVASSRVMAYAGIPLTTSRGHVLGSLCVLDERPRQWSERELALLADLAELLQADIQHRLAARTVAEGQRLGRQVAERVDAMTDAVAGLIELAEQQDDPRLQRHAAVARSRVARVGEAAGALRTQAGSTSATRGTAAGSPTVDLTAVVQRSVAGVRGVTRTSLVRMAAAPGPIEVRCDAVQLERAVTHAVLSALHHSTEQTPVDVDVTAVAATVPDDRRRARLTVTAPTSRIPPAELGRIVARFHAVADPAGAGSADVGAAIRLAGGAVTATAGHVHGRSSREGSTVTAHWPAAQTDAARTIRLP